ncbi:hypothetical protein HDU85_006180 [Gaertneriomyces sp. JEL0708]|nr:hypothetical protein HDU85_006180 [Gaertneriomyces sp. JEL0708]
MHDPESQFKCEWEGCEFLAAYSGGMQYHIRSVHTKERPFKCSHEGCDYAAVSSSILFYHSRTHTEETPHQCPMCEYSANKPDSVKRHMVYVHTDEKPHKCPYKGCSYRYVALQEITRHLCTHTNERPFKCDTCESSYVEWFVCVHKYQLKQHDLYQHRDDGRQRVKREEGPIKEALESAKLVYEEQRSVYFSAFKNDCSGSWAVIDFVITICDEDGTPIGYVFLEVDEEQHRHYPLPCEVMADGCLQITREHSEFNQR